MAKSKEDLKMSNVEHDPDTATNDNVIDRPTNETGSLTNLASLQENFNQQQVSWRKF